MSLKKYISILLVIGCWIVFEYIAAQPYEGFNGTTTLNKEFEKNMLGEKWNVGQTKYGIKLVSLETGLLTDSATFSYNGTIYQFKENSSFSITNKKITIESINSVGGYLYFNVRK